LIVAGGAYQLTANDDEAALGTKNQALQAFGSSGDVDKVCITASAMT